MFDTVRLKVRGLATMCETMSWSCFGAYVTALSMRSTPWGSPSRLRVLVSPWITFSRRTGSGSSHGRSMNMNEMRLPSFLAGARTFTGTIVLSFVGVLPRAARRAAHFPTPQKRGSRR